MVITNVESRWCRFGKGLAAIRDRKSTRLNSSHANISYAVFCLKKKNTPQNTTPIPEPVSWMYVVHETVTSLRKRRTPGSIWGIVEKLTLHSGIDANRVHRVAW